MEVVFLSKLLSGFGCGFPVYECLWQSNYKLKDNFRILERWVLELVSC